MVLSKIIAIILGGLPLLAPSTITLNKPNDTMQTDTVVRPEVYQVKKLSAPIHVDGNWNKDQWKNIQTINIQRHMGEKPAFVPTVEAKMAYDDQNIFVIFRVQDKFVHSTVTSYNGPVSKNSCVEFFFSPDTTQPLWYFNLEVNAGGTPLIFHMKKPHTKFDELKEEDIRQIEIAHSLPAVVDPEIKEPTTWTIEYRVPLAMLEKYSKVTRPAPGVAWKANFYKTGSETSNPNYMTWSYVEHPRPNFHLPQYFGTVVFQ